jgi:6-phosphogluconolactonase
MTFLRRVPAVVALAFTTLLTACGSFFVCQKSSCPVTPPTTNTGDYLYVSNSPTGPNYIAGYSIGTGSLTAIAGVTAFNLGFTPVAMTVSPNNGFLYVASDAGATNPGVYLYTISSTGALTVANGGSPIVNDDTISTMTISPDGNFLFTLGTSLVGGVILSEYALSATTGIPSGNVTTLPTNASSCALNPTGNPVIQQCSIAVSPSNLFVAVALGQAGVLIYPYTSAGGALIYTQVIAAPSASTGDYSLAFDANNYLYVSGTNTLLPYGGLGGTSAPTQGTGQNFAAGITPRSVTLDSTGAYVYTANIGNGTISSFTIGTAGALATLGTAQMGPTTLSALGVDNSGKYLVAAGYNASNGIQLFNITSTGLLTAADINAATGISTSNPMLIALTH